MKLKPILYAAIMAAMCVVSPACSNDDDVTPVYEITVTGSYPSGVGSTAIKSGEIVFTELNTGNVYKFDYPMTATDAVPATRSRSPKDKGGWK
ncbi:MAG: hypothetical protein K2K05_06755 [Muribaculaceae bacterium]|nr:hypothetical protein [Muribaculaceae bacterium]